MERDLGFGRKGLLSRAEHTLLSGEIWKLRRPGTPSRPYLKLEGGEGRWGGGRGALSEGLRIRTLDKRRERSGRGGGLTL